MNRIRKVSGVILLGVVGGTCAFAQLPASGVPPAPGVVSQIKVMPDKAPDCSSLKSIVESITRGCANNDAKAVAIYNFMQLSHYHNQYPSEPGGVPALKEMVCYGWSLCGGLHAEQSALWRELGWGWQFVGWDGHTTVEAQYDGRWHYLDIFLKFYAWAPDGKGGWTIAGEDELTAHSDALITKAFYLDKSRDCVYLNDNPFAEVGDSLNWQAPAFLVCSDTLNDVIGGLKTHKRAGSPEGWAGINHATGNYSTDVNLAPGFSLVNTWDPIPDAWYWAGKTKAPRHSCGAHKDTRNDPGIGLVLEPYINSKPARSYGNGILAFTPDFSNASTLKSFAGVENVRFAGKEIVPADSSKPASVTVRLASPYILTKASGEAAGATTAEVSVDDGKTFKPVDLKDFSAAVKGRLSVLVRLGIKEALTALKLEAIVQNNPGALPYLSPGKNVITVSVANPKELGDNKLVVTYAYRLGSRSKSFEQLHGGGMELAKQHHAKWSDTVTYVRKSFSAKDLPASFEIDCPTPKGAYPVYPRMMFVQREVVSPNALPLPLPAGAVAATPATGDALQALPNPFLVGTQKPKAVEQGPVMTTRVPLSYIQYVSDKGEVNERGSLQWPKTEKEAGKVTAGAVLIDGNLKKDLPAKGIVAARLMVPVEQGHGSAPGKLGVVFLSSSIEKGKPCAVKDLVDICASTVIPRQPDDIGKYNPPKMFAIDVSRAIKAIASGKADFHGLALRMVPDRGVDDGYTVRCDIAPAGDVYLEIDVAAPGKAPGSAAATMAPVATAVMGDPYEERT